MCSNSLEGCIRDMNFSGFTVAFRPTGDIHGVTKKTVSRHPTSNHACSNHSTVNSNTDLLKTCKHIKTCINNINFIINVHLLAFHPQDFSLVYCNVTYLMLDCTRSLHVCQSGLVVHQPPYRHRQWSPPIAEHMRAHHVEIT